MTSYLKTLFFGMMVVLQARAAESQEFQFETRPPSEKMWDGGTEALLREEGLRLPASKPSQEDPQGNWGFPNVGWQLSVRPVRSEFSAGEPVYVWAILRNVSGTNSQYTVTIPETKWDISVATTDGRVVEPKYAWAFKREFENDKAAILIRAKKEIINGSRQYEVPANHQGLHLLRLSEDYDFSTPGNYNVTFGRRFYRFGRMDFSEVMSGTATFRIVEKTGAASPNTNALTNLAAQSSGQDSLASKVETGKTSPSTATPGSDGVTISAAPGATSKRLGSQGLLVMAVVGFAILGLLLAAFLRRLRK